MIFLSGSLGGHFFANFHPKTWLVVRIQTWLVVQSTWLVVQSTLAHCPQNLAGCHAILTVCQVTLMYKYFLIYLI